MTADDRAIVHAHAREFLRWMGKEPACITGEDRLKAAAMALDFHQTVEGEIARRNKAVIEKDRTVIPIRPRGVDDLMSDLQA